MTDREQLLAWQQDQQAEHTAVSHVQHYEGLGIGLAAFCVAMYTALAADGMFTREETLRMVQAAVAGR